MSELEIYTIILEDMQRKRQFPANFDTPCSMCFTLIVQGQPFAFIGESRRVCEECQGKILEFLEQVIERLQA